MRFTPISVEAYMRRHLAMNPTDDRHALELQLRSALAAAAAGVRCPCGEPIWALGSALAGNRCFTCVTGEAFPTDDFELVN
jgi:hypothetical protein